MKYSKWREFNTKQIAERHTPRQFFAGLASFSSLHSAYLSRVTNAVTPIRTSFPRSMSDFSISACNTLRVLLNLSRGKTNRGVSPYRQSRRFSLRSDCERRGGARRNEARRGGQRARDEAGRERGAPRRAMEIVKATGSK